MERRRFLAAAGVAGASLLAGCPGRTEPPPSGTSTDEPSPTNESSPTDGPTSTPQESASIHVAPDGSDTNPGTEDAPLRTIQAGIDEARPGHTVECAKGYYRENLRTTRSGTADAPITLTGPSDAVVLGKDNGLQLRIQHDHIHVTGLTFDGLQNRDAPDNPNSYAGQNIFVEPEIEDGTTPDYLRDVKIKPHAVGNTLGSCTNVNLSRDVEVGPFGVIGPAGLRYLLDGDIGWFGEIVYLGSFIGDVHRYEGIELDRTSNVHVHHIDNSGGYPHSNLVDAKVGTHDVTIEYCTDAGGAGVVSGGKTASIAVRGTNSVVRWNRLNGGEGIGINVGSRPVADPEASDTKVPESALDAGQSNSIYGNSITGFAGPPIYFQVSSQKQNVICGNEYDGTVAIDADTPCSRTLQKTDIGHTGGDSPWD